MVPPTVQLRPGVVDIDGSLSISSILNVFDTDGDAIVSYEFRDNGLGGGYFELNGQRQAPTFTVPAGFLGLVIYRGGSVDGGESITVTASDGELSSSRTANITTGNSSPVVTGRNARVKPGEQIRVDQLISVQDRDGDAIRQYGFVDRADGFNSGQFYLDGNAQFQSSWFFLPANEFSSVTYEGGNAGRLTERLSVLVYDGFSYSEIADFTITTSAKPVISAGVQSEVLAGQKIAASELFTFSDQDGDAAGHYFFVDRASSPGGGFFEFKGQAQTQAEFFRVSANELNQLFYVGGGTSPQAENIGVLVYDGFEYSDVVDLPIRTVSAPLVGPPVVVPITTDVQINQAVPATELFTAVDPDGDPIQRYWLVDRRTNAFGGHFEVDGVRQESGTFFSVAGPDIANVVYRGGAFGTQTENIGVQVLAGDRLSPITNVAVTTLPNLNAPVLTLNSQFARVGEVFEARELFSHTDVEGNPLRTFGFYDTTPTGGFFTENGVRLTDNVWHTRTFDQIDNFQYHIGANPNKQFISMFVSDGLTSGAVSTQMEAFQPAIRVIDNDISIDTLELVDFKPLVEEFEGYDTFQVLDENLSNSDGPSGPLDRSSKLLLDGNALEANTIHNLTAAEFDRLQIRGAEVDLGRRLDPILFRASIGSGNFSEWERINVNTDPVGADALVFRTDEPIRRETILPDLVGIPGVPDESKHVITYSFIDGGLQTGEENVAPGDPPVPLYYDGGDIVRTKTLALNLEQRESIRQTLISIEESVNIDFVEVPFQLDAANAQLTFGSAEVQPSAGAFAFVPPPVGSTRDGRGEQAGDIWYNTLYYSPIPVEDPEFEGEDPPVFLEPRPVTLGSQFYATTLHEVGHALGLKHPFEDSPALTIFNDFEYNTVLAYNSDSVDNPEQSHPEAPSTLMLYDIVRLQQVYGANPDFNSGDTVYVIDAIHQRTLYDTGGYDTLDYSAKDMDEIIDLREGQWSTIDSTPLSLRPAYGVTIEAVIGGSGNDSIEGNEVSNRLQGRAGNDTLVGNGDNDQLFGGAGDDTYIYSLGDGRDFISEEGLGGTDTLEVRDATGSFDSLEEGLVFRRFGNDLRIDLRIEREAGQGTVFIKDFGVDASEVETLKIFGVGGDQIGEDIDLLSVFAQSDDTFKRFAVTATENANGFAVAQV